MGTEFRFHGVDREWGLGYFFKKCEDRVVLCIRSWAEGSVFLGSRRPTPVCKQRDKGGWMKGE